ncbi:MAG: hypothetical protein IJG37_10095 [Synergistaceae bacterium]|nr:hypothetical protein [Synergistaceae bacterium]
MLDVSFCLDMIRGRTIFLWGCNFGLEGTVSLSAKVWRLSSRYDKARNVHDSGS